MKKFIVLYSLVFVLTMASGVMLVRTSHEVQRAQEKLVRLDRAIDEEKGYIRILKAEWSYLNRPQRLETLAAQYLDLVPPAPDTLVSNALDVPDVSALEEGPVFSGPAVGEDTPVIEKVSFVQNATGAHE